MIERRRNTVYLYQGDDLERLSDLREQVAAAIDREAVGNRRMSQKSEAAKLAREHDELQDAADERAVKVTLWALTNDQFEQLSELHPPRDEVKSDERLGLNAKTMPGALLRASMIAPDEAPADVSKVVEKGAVKLAALGDLTRVQMHKLETSAWNVNVEDDSLPKLSLVSLLRRERGDEREQQQDSE